MYDKLRKGIVLKCKVDFIVNLPFDVFRDAFVDTCIIILTKQTMLHPINEECLVFEYKKRERIGKEIEPLNFNHINYSLIVNEPSNRVYMQTSLYQLQNKLSSYPTLAATVASTRGIEAYQYKFSGTKALSSNYHWEKYYEFGNNTSNTFIVMN
jgi:hypothetical protein